MDFALTVDGQSISLLGTVALGAGVGVVAGMFGVGGGFLLVPLLGALLGVPLQAAVAAGLPAGNEPPAVTGNKAVRPNRSWPVFPHDKGKEFVDFDEDLQIRDIERAVASIRDKLTL